STQANSLDTPVPLLEIPVSTGPIESPNISAVVGAVTMVSTNYLGKPEEQRLTHLDTLVSSEDVQTSSNTTSCIPTFSARIKTAATSPNKISHFTNAGTVNAENCRSTPGVKSTQDVGMLNSSKPTTGSSLLNVSNGSLGRNPTTQQIESRTDMTFLGTDTSRCKSASIEKW
ncbi:unnamed protein product, partial [Protopolystoma xenopodis]